jgi:hypothetical protein
MSCSAHPVVDEISLALWMSSTMPPELPAPPDPRTLQGIGAAISELSRQAKDGFEGLRRDVKGVREDVLEVREELRDVRKEQMRADIRMDKVEERLEIVEESPAKTEASETAARAAEAVAQAAAEAARSVASAASLALKQERRERQAERPSKISLETASKVVLNSMPPPKYDLGVQISDSGVHMKMPTDEYKRLVTQNQAAAALRREKWVLHKGSVLLMIVASAFLGGAAKSCASALVHSHVENRP